jgi:hypothetical protein
VRLVPRSLLGRIAFYGALGALATAVVLAVTGPLMGPDPVAPSRDEDRLGDAHLRLRQNGAEPEMSTPEIAVALAVAASVVLLVTVIAEQVVARRRR